MSEPFVDTDVIIRLLTGDDPVKQDAAAAFFEQIERGEFSASCPETVIADAVYVLASPHIYGLPREQVAELLLSLVQTSGLKIRNRNTVLQALTIYASTSLEFGDAMTVAAMQQAGSTILYSYDRGFDRIPGITRREP